MKRPQRDLPIGIIASLLICSSLYYRFAYFDRNCSIRAVEYIRSSRFALQFIGQDSLGE